MLHINQTKPCLAMLISHKINFQISITKDETFHNDKGSIHWEYIFIANVIICSKSIMRKSKNLKEKKQHP